MAGREFYTGNFTSGEFLVLAVESAKKNDWELLCVNETGFRAIVGTDDPSRYFEVVFRLNGEQAVIKSNAVGSTFGWWNNRKIIEAFSDTLAELKMVMKPEELKIKYEELKNQVEETNPEELVTTPNAFQLLFIPRKDYLVTPLVVAANILLFIVMILSGVHFFQPDADTLLAWGANFRPATQNGEWWRLLTCCFLHFGILHLAMNMYALLYIGILLEPFIGSGKFAAAYLLTGICASITSFWWHDLTVSAGASGAVFGMYGVFLSLLSTNLMEKESRKPLLLSIGVFVLFNLANGMKDGIDNAAHIGGLISGLVIGYSYFISLRYPDARIRNTAIHAVALLLIASVSVSMIRDTSDNLLKYNNLMDEFAKAEEIALELYHQPDGTSDQVFLNIIRQKGLPYWKKCSALVETLDSLPDLPEALKERNRLMKKYCHYRLVSYSLIAESLEKQTTIYDKQIETYTTKIELIINKLNGEQVDDRKINIYPLDEFAKDVPSGILYVVDGKPVACIDSVDQSKIVSVLVIPPGKSEPVYGIPGKNGAVIIKTLHFQKKL